MWKFITAPSTRIWRNELFCRQIEIIFSFLQFVTIFKCHIRNSCSLGHSWRVVNLFSANVRWTMVDANNLLLKSGVLFVNTNLNVKHAQTAHNIPFVFVQKPTNLVCLIQLLQPYGMCLQSSLVLMDVHFKKKC